MSEQIKIYDKKKNLMLDLSLLLVALVWGGSFVALKNALDVISPLFLMAIRFTATFIIMSIIFNKKLKIIGKKDIRAGTIIGLFVFLAFTAQAYGLKYTTVSKQAFLVGTNVVIVPFLTWIIHKKSPGWEALTGAVLSCIGIGLLTLQGYNISINIGDVLSLGCAFFIAASIVAIDYFSSDSDPITLVITQMGAAALFFIIIAFVCEPIPKNITTDVIFSLSYIVLLATIGAFLIQNVAQKYIPPTHTAIILCMESVFATLLAALILKEKMTVFMVLGCLLILLSILISETKLSFFKRAKMSLREQ
ncbi:DMT family transporter [Paramaledivibacter caminithermalis]|jgi:drug/metabolite transporter (DMT)-like permease|uniref:Permease of the drug/metabolite transporter (DMT) superfamily n=1 Tax=Paramaledivibacter caminithermalis (strain DSM 15212 / CIP 107654 / DViRD3) TaxID=1121301 RepID=A0A1M6PA42_PARC5|nr:DMT family transporter [Paramaledivibacter caminithermalis]SHK04797.1 Permease of the drug/metabolite transporter (DMT) superfamily [Paramaledivibacter caminithermalis DSM 15212]